MGLQVEIRAGNQIHRMSLLAADDQILSLMSGERFCEVLWQSKVEEQIVDSSDFLMAAKTLLEDLRKLWDVLPYRYSFDAPSARYPMSRSSGGWSGFLINGQAHSIKAGGGFCYLTETRWEDGRITKMEHRDVRDQKVIQTDSDGPIRIFRSKLKVSLLEGLAATIEFLKRVREVQIGVQLAEGRRSTMELIRAITQEDDEGAKEELFDQGQSAKDELLVLLSSKKARKHRPTIAYLLLILFRSPESRAAVEELAEREKDPKVQQEYLTLLAAIA